MSDWQAMETAPKDGTVILTYWYKLGSFSWRIAYYNKLNQQWIDYNLQIYIHPTHWQPLTKPEGIKL